MDWEKLIQEKSFDSLTPEERQQLEAALGPTDFAALQQTWEATRLYFRDTAPLLTPDPSIRKRVREHMRTLEPGDWGTKVRQLLIRRIPAYQAIAAAVVLFALVQLGGKMMPAHNSGTGQPQTMYADSTLQDSSHRVGFNLYEDSAFTKFMIEAL